MLRRQCLRRLALTPALLPGMPPLLLATMPQPVHALTPRPLEFPRDHGAHPDFRTEWWYLTGVARAPQTPAELPPDFGFQITFFRSRLDNTQGMASSFAAKQLVFAHAAVTDVRTQRLVSEQRVARMSGSGNADLARTGQRTADIELRDWTFKRETVAVAGPRPGHGGPSTPARYRARIVGREMALELVALTTQPLLLQGDSGVSRKGPQATQASFYYTEPHLQVRGDLTVSGKTWQVDGTAWLDHEWSETLMPPDAVGWDWIGINLDDGSSLTAFQLRDAKGGAVWDGGTFRAGKASGRSRDDAFALYVFNRGEVVFRPVRHWKSPSTGASYPVEWLVRTTADVFTVRALVEAQELDSRASTGTVYWEGLSEVLNSAGKRVGYGYLEMTGYAGRLRL